MNIMVTGSSGFIGGHLCDAFARGQFYEHHALANDVNLIAAPAELRALNVSGMQIKVDRIYHLAGAPSPVRYGRNPVETIMTAVQGTYNILNLAQRTGARVLFTSTADVDRYFPSDNARAVYVDSKKVAEDLCYQFRKMGVDVRVARLFSTYGPGMKRDDGRVIPAFISAAINNNPIIISGDGRQIDSFCYVDDMTKALHALMEGDDPGRPIDIGNPILSGPAAGLTTIADLAEKIIEVCGSSSEIRYNSSARTNPQRIPDIIYAKNKLGWMPQIGLNNGLTKTVRAFKGVSI